LISYFVFKKNGVPMASGYGKVKVKIIINQLFCINNGVHLASEYGKAEVHQ
jgi:hypothetical protein